MNNKLPKITYVFNRHKRSCGKTKASIEIRISYDRHQKYISTGISIYPNQWKRDKVVNCPDEIQLNNFLDKLLIDVRQIIFEMTSEGNVDINAIPDKLKLMHQQKMSFIDFCKQRAKVRKYGKTPDSQKRYDRFIKDFEEWNKIVFFNDINEYNIILYDEYLKGKGLQTYSKWNNYHRFMNSFILDAVNEGLLQKNPYHWVNIEKGKNSKGIHRCLTPEEFLRLKTIHLPTESLERVRDVFVFQTYTCLSYSDLSKFNAADIKLMRGMNVYTGVRKKTHHPFTIPLLGPAMDILHKYNGKLPVISNVKYNEYLKVVAQASGIDKPLSSHWARHTGATLLLNEGVDMKIISKICGHSSSSITEKVYAKMLDETVVDAIENIKDLV